MMIVDGNVRFSSYAEMFETVLADQSEMTKSLVIC